MYGYHMTTTATLSRVRNIVEEGFTALSRQALDTAADHLDRAERMAEGLSVPGLLAVQPDLDALGDLLNDSIRKARTARQAKGAFVVAGELA